MNHQTQTVSAAPATPNAEKLLLDLADRLELGARLRRLRESTGLTTLQVAEQVLGYQGSHAAVSRLERGVFAAINRAHLDLLAPFYGTTVADLLAGTDGSDTAAPPVIEGVWRLDDVAPGAHTRLRDLRQAMRLTQKEFSQRLGHKTHAYYRQVERGDVVPRPDELLKVALEFQVSGSWLILGQKGRVTKPTQALRVRALRLLKGASRGALALEADSQDFMTVRTAVGLSENRGIAMPWEVVEKLAVAFDVPPEFLDPQGASKARAHLNEAPTSAAEALYQAETLLPKQTQKLLEQIRAMSALDMFSPSDCAAMLKELSVRTWKRPALAA